MRFISSRSLLESSRFHLRTTNRLAKGRRGADHTRLSLSNTSAEGDDVGITNDIVVSSHDQTHCLQNRYEASRLRRPRLGPLLDGKVVSCSKGTKLCRQR
jgi:hypothetical protein